MKFHDDELMAMYKAGVQEAFTMLYERYGNNIYRFALSSLRKAEDAEDVVQEVFLRVARAAGTFHSQGRFKAWLFQIAANRIRSLAATQSRTGVNEINLDINQEFQAPSNHDPEQQLILRDMLEKSIALLPLNQRMVLLLREVEGMKSEAIAETLCLSPENTRVLLHRARQQMILLLGRQEAHHHV